MDINLSNLKNIIYNYQNLNNNEKLQLHKYIKDVWGDIYSEYYELCNTDKDLRQSYLKLKEIQNIIKFDWKYYYFKLDINKTDSLDDMYVFDKEHYDYEKNVYENLGVINLGLLEKKQVLKTQIRNLNIDINHSKKNDEHSKQNLIKNINNQIQELNDEIDKIDNTILKNEEIAEHFGKLAMKECEKKFYLDNYETQISPIYNRYKERINDLAVLVVEKIIKEKPIILCCENPIFDDEQDDKNYKLYVLTDVFKTVRDFLLKEKTNLVERDNT